MFTLDALLIAGSGLGFVFYTILIAAVAYDKGYDRRVEDEKLLATKQEAWKQSPINYQEDFKHDFNFDYIDKGE